MTLTFIEASGFTHSVPSHFPNDEAYARLQEALLNSPEQGDVMLGCGGLRKMRWRDARRGKGTRGGLRVIYLHVPESACILLLDVYDKDEADDLSPADRKTLASLAQQFRAEIQRRSGGGRKQHGN